MIQHNLEQNDWKIPPDNTVQVVDPLGIEQKELNQSGQNWMGICISLGIIAFVCGLVAITAAILIPLQPPPFEGRRLCLSDLSDPDLVAEPSGIQWLSAEEIAFASEKDGIILMNVSNRSTTQLISKKTLHQTSAREFYVSSSQRYVLLSHDVIEGRLYTQTAKYSIYDVKHNLYFPLKLHSTNVDHPRFQYVSWIKQQCTAGVQDELVVIDENDIYYLASPTGPVTRLTQTGEENLIFNGVPDIVYEEILKSSSCVWSNTCGKYLAYVSFNNGNVSKLPILQYPDNSPPKVVHLPYATVNTPLPSVSIWVYDLNSVRKGIGKKWKVRLPAHSTKNYYLLGIGWSDNSELWVSYLARNQSTTVLVNCPAPTWHCNMIFSNYLQDGISPLIQNVVWDGPWAIFPWPENPSQKSWHNQVVLVGARGGKPPPLTLEEYNVKEVLASSSADQSVYFLGSKISQDIMHQQLYKVVKLDGSVVCISCHLRCKYIKAELNHQLTYAAVMCIHERFPAVHLIKLDDPAKYFNLHSQPNLRKNLKKIALPIYIQEEIDLSDEIHASVNLKLPPDWNNQDDSFLFPLIVQTVGIENLNLKDKALRVGLSELLPSGYHVAHAQIQLYGNFPFSSSEDVSVHMAFVLRYLFEKYSFLDKHQVYGWGWGSGASVALKLSSSELSVFKCVAAINPVYNWKHYASFWAERLLGPLDSQNGRSNYEESHLYKYLEALKIPEILLVQSTGDPLSHHSFRVVETLLHFKMQIRHVVYPDSSLALHRETHHLLLTLLDFFLRPECVNNYHVKSHKKKC